MSPPKAPTAGDYVVVYFKDPVTFRGRTVDVYRSSEHSDRGITAVHAQSHLIVSFAHPSPGEPMQTQLVPWSNVRQAEPTPEFLAEYTGAMRAARGKGTSGAGAARATPKE